MRTILDAAECYEPLGEVEIQEGLAPKTLMRPKLPILSCNLGCERSGTAVVPVTVLLDTGSDITIVNPLLLDELFQNSVRPIPSRRIEFHGNKGTQYEPAYPLVLYFPNESAAFYSPYQVVAPEHWTFDAADVWLGQDILSQLRVTFDGPAETVTIGVP